jgi:hypothetical protein
MAPCRNYRAPRQTQPGPLVQLREEGRNRALSLVATCCRNLRLVVAVAGGPAQPLLLPGPPPASANAAAAVRVSAAARQQRSELALHAITPLRLR